MFKKSIAATILTSLMALGATANAASFSFTGTFDRDDDVQLFRFTLGAASVVTLRTHSYAGGTQSNGNVVAAGGFDPILALFDASGTRIGQNDDGGASVAADPVTGGNFDTFLDAALAPGSYTLALMQFDNYSIGPTLSDGFVLTGQPAFTAAYRCSNGVFCDIARVNRTNAWAFDIRNVDDAAPVPLPAAASLLLAGIAALGLARHPRRHA